MKRTHPKLGNSCLQNLKHDPNLVIHNVKSKKKKKKKRVLTHSNFSLGFQVKISSLDHDDQTVLKTKLDLNISSPDSPKLSKLYLWQVLTLFFVVN